jgi:hypothetical protein
MRSISLVLVVASMACYRDASPTAAPSAPPITNKVAPRPEPIATGDALAFLPVDSEVVATVDFQAIRASAIWAEYEPLVRAAVNAGPADARSKCELDLVKSLRSITLGIRTSEGMDSVVVIRGIDRDAFLSCLSVRGSGSMTLISNDRGVLTFTPRHGRNPIGSFADRTTLVLLVAGAPTPDSVRAVLRSGAPLRRSPDFLAMFERLSPEVALSFVVNGNVSALRTLPFTGPRLRGLYAEIGVDQSVAAAVHLLIDDATQAPSIAASLDQFLQQSRQLFDKLRATSDGEVVTVECELSSTKLQTLVTAAASMYQGRTATP